jgi:FkbM family methyltransferase
MTNKTLIKQVGDFKMHLDYLKRGISSSLWGQGYREPAFMWIVENEAIGKIGIDLGANLGYVTLHMCKKMDKIIAIEPDKRMRKLLKKNIKENRFKDKVEIYNFAVSNKDGEETIYFSKKHPNLNTLCDNKKLKMSKDLLKKEKIKTKKIDNLNVDPNFIKMDIEGYEIEAIEGSMNTLKKTKKCKLLIEVHPQYYNKKRDFSETLKKLFDIGFGVKYIVSAGCECPDLFKEKGYSPFKIFQDDERKRGLFKGILKNDAINFCSFEHIQKEDSGKVSLKIARSILLVKEK